MPVTMSGSQDDERLSAYLDDELDAAQTAELEAQLAADPSLTARLDAVCDVMVALRGLDQVPLPEGFTDRLRDRVAQERLAARVVPLPRRRSWVAVLSGIAAALLVAALAGTAVLQVLQQGDLAERSRASLATPHALRVLPDEAAVRGYFAPYATRPEMTGIALRRCLDAVAPEGGTSVVTHVEPVVFQGQAALAYVVRQDRTARAQAVIVDPTTCQVRSAVPLE